MGLWLLQPHEKAQPQVRSFQQTFHGGSHLSELRTRKTSRVDDDETAMLTTHLGVFADDRFEVDAVVGDQGSALLLSYFEKVGIAQPPEAWVLRGGSDVVAAVSESIRDLAADLLVEEELHAKAACSRCQAASASSASAVLRVMRRSISSGKAP